MSGRGTNVLIGVTGSVASIKLPLLMERLTVENKDLCLKVITTERAKHFFNSERLLPHEERRSQSCTSHSDNAIDAAGLTGCADLTVSLCCVNCPAMLVLQRYICPLYGKVYEIALEPHSLIEQFLTGNHAIPSAADEADDSDLDKYAGEEKCDQPNVFEVLCDDDEWSRWKEMGDPVLHVELCKWADVFVIAPLDANTLGKLANGLCDNLITCTFRAWDMDKPLIFCPAMNTRMWTHPMTAEHISRLVSWGYTLVPPVSKKLACGDEGTGAMAEVSTIVDIVLHTLKCRS